MDKFFTYALTAAITLGLTACDDDDVDIITPSERDSQYEAIANQYLDNTVIVTYRNLADNAENLVEDLETLQASKTDANVRKACTSFLEARAWWEKSEAFLFGPAADFGIDPHIDSWPLDLDGLVAEMRNADHIGFMAGEDGDVWVGTHLGPELLGFHGIEYILFRNGNPRPAADIPADQLIYAIAVAGDLRNKTYQLELSWAGEGNVDAAREDKIKDLEWGYTVLGGGNSYKQNMLAAGKPGSSYRSMTDAMQAIIDGCIDICDEVGTQKIGKPHTGEDINYIESPYSHKSITDFHDNMLSIENAYLGGIEGKRNESTSLHAYIRKVNPDLDNEMIAGINNVKSRVNAMAAPFVLNYRDSSAKEAMEACDNLVIILTKVKAQLAK